MGDYILNVRVDGREADDRLEKVVKQMNDIQEKAKKTEETQRKMNAARRELANYARKEREEIFNALPIEERINRLLERREQIQRRINATTSEERRTMLTLALRRTSAGINDLEREREARNRERAGEVTRTALEGVPGGALAARLLSKVGAQGAMAAAVIGAGVYGVKKSMDISDMADNLDMTTNSLQKFAFVAKAAGGNIEGLTHLVDNIKKAQSEALTGNKSYIEDFKRIGVSLNDIRNKSAVEIFYKIAEGIRNGSINATQFSSTMAILGRESKGMMSVLKNDLAELSKQWDEWNLSISNGTIVALKEIGETAVKYFLMATGALRKLVVEGIGFWARTGKLELIGLLSLLEKAGIKPAAGLRQSVQESYDRQVNAKSKEQLEQEKKDEETAQRKDEVERIKKAKAAEAAANIGTSIPTDSKKPSSLEFSHDRLAELGIYRGNVFNQQQNDIRTAIGHIRDADEKLISIERSVNSLAHAMLNFRV